MRISRTAFLGSVLAVLTLCGCGYEEETAPKQGAAPAAVPGPPPAPEPPKPPPTPDEFLPEAGKTPEATLRAYFYYKDRGDFISLRPLVASNSLAWHPKENAQGMSERARKARGLIVDHVDVGEDEATVYYRSWFSKMTESMGGRPYIARLLKEDGLWKHDTKTSVELTMSNTKGKTRLGLYDGTKGWWK